MHVLLSDKREPEVNITVFLCFENDKQGPFSMQAAFNHNRRHLHH